MQIHQLQPTHISKSRKIVGRGGKKGTYSGRGGKGQTARSGRKLAPIIRELIKRYPKLKGYRRFVLSKNIVIINLDILEKVSKNNQIISPQTLLAQGVISGARGKTPIVKILGNGKLTKKVIVENCQVSKTAKQSIEKAGGAVK